ncbi:GDSL-type esterase/lipase family protein [Anaeromassilibacillus sp. SJQ-5]
MIRQPESKSALKRKKRHRRRALRIAFLVSIVILVMFAVVMLVAFALQKTGWLPESSSAGSSAPPAATTTPPATTTTTEPATTTATFAGGTTAIGSGQVADSYFDDAAFIGDSRTQGLQLYTGLPNATFYATQGLMVDTFFSKKFVKAGGGKITIPDAMKNQTFKKVYIMLGVNELGWAYEKVFIQKYGEVVDKVKELQPDAKIYVQSILPVTKAKSDGDAIYNNTKISRYNELIEQMCREKGVTYLHVADAVGLDNGALPAGSATDGVHLNREYCYKWLDYLKTHTK